MANMINVLRCVRSTFTMQQQNFCEFPDLISNLYLRKQSSYLGKIPEKEEISVSNTNIIYVIAA